MSRIEVGLHEHHAAQKRSTGASTTSTSITPPTASAAPSTGSVEAPFAKVNSVVVRSPADDAGLKAGDLIRRFGSVDWMNHENLSRVAVVVQRSEGVSSPLRKLCILLTSPSILYWLRCPDQQRTLIHRSCPYSSRLVQTGEAVECLGAI
jgi:hypothetical protein